VSRYRLYLSSELRTPAPQVWAQISTMAGVNRELWPIVMTAPRGMRIDGATPLGTVAFRSLLLLGGVLPMDLHWLRMESVTPGEGFQEASWSLTEREWRHRRRLQPTSGGCRIEDELDFTPRFAAALLSRIVRHTFLRRHRRLGRWFGALTPPELSLTRIPGACGPDSDEIQR
jgi:ligand-binding SRPBCC domain-containing protein